MGRPKSLPLQTARGGAVGGGRPSAGHAGREPEPDRALTSLAGECFSPGTDPPARAHPRPRGAGQLPGAAAATAVGRGWPACTRLGLREAQQGGGAQSWSQRAALGLGWPRPRPGQEGVWASLLRRLPSLAGASRGLAYGSQAGAWRSRVRRQRVQGGNLKSWGLVDRGGGSELVQPPSWRRQVAFPSVRREQ